MKAAVWIDQKTFIVVDSLSDRDGKPSQYVRLPVPENPSVNAEGMLCFTFVPTRFVLISEQTEIDGELCPTYRSAKWEAEGKAE